LFALLEEKLNQLLNQLNISRISGLTGYPAGYLAAHLISGRIPDIKKRPDYPAGRISGASLLEREQNLCF
jgi:hypothetical protein